MIQFLQLRQVMIIDADTMGVSIVRCIVMVNQICSIVELKPDYVDADFAMKHGAKSCISTSDRCDIYVTDDIETINSWLIGPAVNEIVCTTA